ncbi:hypothetical protein CROQUDRAFT_90562 [Cronartium quercuum f. sp. fusiforme G11]|uniref:Meiotically up-regulated protein Msb1/Mug8 domain-containing protein n=1 Tax=Cronartium quercuum f. sp. fusiforme G11 TaxID=708437 RepID=A0A9P6NJL3_9BASI|nr:hypothetical protein CROQUDRAFT_90562 [Cronartium quercuum f. sp. fusiforme G11]
MHSIFKHRNKSTKSSSNSVKTLTNQTHIDEFGNPILNPIPAFTLASHQETQLLYGYTGLFTEIELDSHATNQVVLLVINQLKSRPLDSPLILSTHALDVSIDGTHSLIRSYLNHQSDLIRDIQISSPHNLSAFLKWILARHTNQRGQHGILDWQTYLTWRSAESDTNYPPDFISSHLFPALPTTTVSLLSTLLDLFSTVSAYSHLNGMTIHKCSAIFGAYIFGLEDDLTFEQTYSHWLRYAHATEHLVLAFLRDQKCKITTKQLPSRLESSILGYPKIIPSLTSTHPSAKLECVARFRRQTRFYNKNLIQNASKWKIEQSKTWSRLQPTESSTRNHQRANSNSSNSSDTLGKFKFTKSYKHLLNITNDSDLDILDDDHHIDLNDELNLETQRFKSLVEKQWSGFMNKGFEETNSEKKLEFDLEESEKLKRRQRHNTMDWDSFAGNGFFGRETFIPNELEFNSNLNQTIQNWPIEQKVLNKKISKASKHLPQLKSLDPLPQELKPILLDENFFEAYADALVCSGWARDELKEVSWALVHYKSRSINCDPNDERNDDMWVLFEEVVPAEYRQMLVASNSKAAKRHRRTSFLRVITRKDPKRNHVSPQSNSTGRPPQSKLPSLSAPFSPRLDGSFPPTRKLTLTRQLPSDAISVHTRRPSINTINTTNTLVNGGSGFVNTGGFMAEFRAKTKKRHQNYNLPTSSSTTTTNKNSNVIFPHQTSSILEQPGSQVWLNVLPEEREDEEEDHYHNHDHYHQIHRPMNPTPPGSSRAVTPEDRLKRYPIRSIPNRKESLSNITHHSSSDLTTISVCSR